MKLIDAMALANHLMEEHHLLVDGWRFEFDNARRRFGLTSFQSKTISLSQFLTAVNSYEKVKNTILHEIAHALVGKGVGHSSEWRATAFSIGCDGKRCYGSETISLARPYQAVCSKCGDLEIRRFKRREGMIHNGCRGEITWKLSEAK